MRILQLHSNFIEYKPIQKEIDAAEEAEPEVKRFEDLVVLFTAVEEGDDESTAKRAIEEIKSSLEKLKVNRILIYPFAHLSARLAAPSTALNVIRAMELYANEAGLEVYRAPFGWNKQFTLSIKGHPLAEQLRVISTLGEEAETYEDKVSKALKAEEKLQSFWYILKPSGELVPIEQFDFHGYENLEKFARYEISKVRASQQMPPHVPLMKKLEIADYEAGSDPGNIRWYPKGRFIKSMIEQYVTAKVLEYGAMEVETPVMYDFTHPSLADYLNRFPARQYILKSEDKELFLRFAACFGQFLMVHDAQLSYRHLPLRLYELTRYSFRREKSGEVVGLKRLRAFTMPDCHAFCADLEQAKDEFIKRFKLCIEVLEGIGLSRNDYEAAIRFTRDFYEENKSFIHELVKLLGKPALVEMWIEPFFYFRLKWEFNFVDNQGKAAALSTDQIDVENAYRYQITYVDEKGERRYPLILHCSPSGAIERCIYALLEKAYREQQKGNPPMLPLWLSPTQVRLIPTSDELLSICEEIAKQLEDNFIRVDIDDRPLTVQKRIREAEMEWIPYIIVIGKKELSSETFPVRDRKSRAIRNLRLEQLIAEIKAEVKGKPFKPLPTPRYVSKRPQFYG